MLRGGGMVVGTVQDDANHNNSMMDAYFAVC